MSEIKQLVNTYHVDMRCDKCGNGYMRTTGLVLPKNPTLYEHQCTYCGHKENYSCAYPTIVTEKVMPLSKEKEERKTGKWIREIRSEADFIKGQYSFRCPFCGEYDGGNYCPECGARMEGFVDVDDIDA